MNLERLEPLFSSDDIENIKNSHVVIFGIGGVGASAALSLARMGVGEITVFDYDVVTDSNINRQAVAFKSTIGKRKVDVIKELILNINEKCRVNSKFARLTKENLDELVPKNASFYVDAIDDINTKIALIVYCHKLNLPLISSTGAGNRTNPTKVRVVDVYKTSNDPIAKAIRTSLRKENIDKQMVVWSEEEPVKTCNAQPSSCVFVPQVFGITLAYYAIEEIVKHGKKR
jgi:tRNA A37 threonylcarbamoyladenosine dehydratase